MIRGRRRPRASAGRPPALTTITGPGDRAWHAVTELLDPPSGAFLPWLLKVHSAARGREVFIGRGTVGFADRYADLLAAAVIRRTLPGTRIVIADATFEPDSRAARRLGRVAGLAAPLAARLLIGAVDGPAVRWCVLSTAELVTFPRVWHVAPDRVVFTPFVTTLDAITSGTPGRDEGFLFAGGSSLRDYDLLERAAAGTAIRIRVAGDWRPAEPTPQLGAGPVPHAEFVELLRSCRGVVVPLRAAVRSAGQQTYLNAMLLGKPVIVTEAPGVRDYIDDGVTGVVVPPDPPALRAAMQHLVDPRNADFYAAMGARAHGAALAFNTTRYRRQLLEIAGLPKTWIAGHRGTPRQHQQQAQDVGDREAVGAAEREWTGRRH